MSRPFVAALVVVVALAGFARPADADITAFLGISPTPDTHAAKGFAVGFGVMVVGFEFEYASLSQNEDEALPGLRTGSGNVLIQTPTPIAVYGTVGGGLYRERLLDIQETSFATNIGGGVKFRLAGPLRARFDYRIFKLTGDPLHDVYHRLYAGANISF